MFIARPPTDAASPILPLDRAQGALIDQTAFEFTHRLHEFGLFDLDRLLKLTETTVQERPRDVYYDAGRVEPGTRWADLSACAFSVTDALRRLEEADAWIILRRVQLDPDYAPLLERCMDDILGAAGPDVVRRAKTREVILFITSPRRVSAFHIDHECGFLMQIRGSKQISVFDKTDRDVLPESELEVFWTRDNNAPTYRPHLQHRATVYPLAPGTGVHLPINAPHWIQNGDEVSVSANINFIEPERERGHVYRANYHLRQLGLKPRPPFESPTLDALKRPLGGLSHGARESIRHLRGALRRAK